MTKVTFIYFDATERSGRCFMVGISIISSVLKKAGHEVSLIHISDEISKEELQKRVREENADVYAFTSISLVYKRIRKYNSWVKEVFPNKLTILGGIQAILNPEESIKDFEAVCIGEGEYCMRELIGKISNKENIYDTKNFWFKKDGEIVKNERLPLIENLDDLPFPDRDMWNYYNLTDYHDAKQITIMASRGCPYMCPYCFNHKIRDLYPNKHKWVRFRSVENVINEIKEVIKKYPGEYKSIRFIDDTIVQNKEWFEELCQKFPKLNLQISCQARANELNEDIIKKLRKLGVVRVEMGIEAGNPFIRNQVMKRYMSDEQIINAFRLCRKYGIVTTSFNILGIPFETSKMMLDSVKINVRAKPNYPYSFIFQPFTNTKAWEICKEFGFLTKDENESLFGGSTLNCPHFRPEEAKFIQTFFRKMIKFYKIRPLWFFYDFIFINHLIPMKTMLRFEKVINFSEYLSQNHPKTTKVIKKLLLWKK